MKIAIIIPNDFSIVWFCEVLVKNLTLKHEVTVICDIHDGYERGHYLEIMEKWGVKHKYVSFYRFFNPLKDFMYIASLIKRLKEEPFDLVMNISTKPNLYGSIAAKIAGIDRIICSVWGLGLAFSDSKSIKTTFLRFVVKILYRCAFRVSDHVWFTNKIDHDYFVTRSIIAESKTTLTKNYVNVREFSPTSVPKAISAELKDNLGYKEADMVVIMVSRLSWAKGVKQFCEAADLLRERYPNVKFLLVGPEDVGSIDSVPLTYVDHYQKQNNFDWVGFRRDVKELYSICDLAVYPSYYREGGYPRGLTEPMAMGKPVITTDSIHCSAAVDDGVTGIIVPIKDSNALSVAIQKIINNATLAANFGAQSRLKAVAELSEDVIIKALIQKII
jgi:N,N'-diacetylbacillosaminyl-diphospho-undecaprenol alpha-1,3-N-acetylgalactosaminyltransferase